MGRQHASSEMYAFTENTLHQTFQGGRGGPSFPGPFSTAQPEFICCKTKLTMLFYICLFYTHAMNLVACMYDYETYGFIHDMLAVRLRHSC